MEWYIICFVEQSGVLRALHCSDSARSLPLFIHLDKCTGMPLGEILGVSLGEGGTFQFEEELYRAVVSENCLGFGQLVFLSDAPVRARLFETVLNELGLGLQIFDTRGRLVFLNDTCRRVESLIKQNVLGKHLREIYTVDENYSTMLNTIKHRKPVKNRCDIFANRFGDKVTSINNGYPLWLDGHFFGALGVVADANTLADFAHQREVLDQYIEKSRGKAVEGRHLSDYYKFEDIVGVSPAMRGAVEIARKVAPSDFSVLLLGETGTGKEMFAQSIHSAGKRSGKPFVAINCAAIPQGIMESMLFGTVKGSFTGSGNQNGLLDEADGGTLFLDELNSMDIQLQGKLLRVLQEKCFRRVGGLKDIKCDFRVISAMNESPTVAIEQGRLRSDLYYRINTITIDILPLRERKEDIPVLVQSYLGRAERTGEKCQDGLTARAAALLAQYDWPGNTRELFHALDHALAMAAGGPLDIDCFPPRLALPVSAVAEECPNYLHQNLQSRLKETERQMILEALAACDGNVSKAAKSLGLSRQNLQYRMKKHAIHTNDTDEPTP